MPVDDTPEKPVQETGLKCNCGTGMIVIQVNNESRGYRGYHQEVYQAVMKAFCNECGLLYDTRTVRKRVAARGREEEARKAHIENWADSYE